ncbi:hypothetical protein BJ322DRAFT_1073121 [Thelephora terrestris]|uniref:DNA replication factor Cdt1 C-terminal domain-containing protein n=1 Tax=Thelephora terrestris TaxID=56493 RepID=A0A9P6HAG1_9AGAM|nr:hypothetical protein BJ322DRAFT_1073121 [Thelephora terrestris]
MSDVYTSLGVSPRKKRRASPGADEACALTPKRIRTRLPTPPSTVKRKPAKGKQTNPLPANLSRLLNIHTTLQQALSHALASCALSPSSDTGIVRDVLTHIALTNYSGLSTTFEIDDLKRICWLWEWDGKKTPTSKEIDDGDEDEDNPFLDTPEAPTPPKDWSRGGMGFVVTSTTHFIRSGGTRVPAYGIGIEVEIDIDKDMGGGMAAVARWTADSESRKTQFKSKLEKWLKLHEGVDPCPNLPKADLPKLPIQLKGASTLTKMFASSSPKSASSAKILSMPQSPSSKLSFGSPKKSPVKQLLTIKPFNITFPTTSSTLLRSPTKSPGKGSIAIFPKTPGKNSVIFPQTPSSHHSSGSSSIFSPRTPRSSFSTPSTSIPSTPSRQKGEDADTAPTTPTTARRQALYERIRQKSITNSPTKHRPGDQDTPKMSRDQLLKLSLEETRRKCLLGRLGGVAESIWMLFSGPAASTTATPSARKRRALPLTEITASIVKSSPVPISEAEAVESVNMLTKLCPFFVKPLNIDGEEWFEMPSTAVAEKDEEKQPPPSPSARKGKGREVTSAEEVLTRSPKRVKREGGGLREVRERIRRELDQD